MKLATKLVGISTEHFTHYTYDKAFVIEQSTLETIPEYKNVHNTRVIPLKSTRTGKIANFQLDKRIRDDEGDVLYTKYIPTEITIKSFPGLQGYELAVLND